MPRSLFDRPMAALRKDAKLVKLKQQGLVKPMKTHHQPLMSRPFMDQGNDQPEWLIHEDWALLQVRSLITRGRFNLMGTGRDGELIR